ncbi:MAG: translocation/assembly module TamB domain-containing protein [Myxococcota bacterium]
MRRGRRVVLALSSMVVVLVVLVVLVIALLLGTSGGTRWVLHTGLSVYSGMIAGEIGFDDSEGSLVGGVVLQGVRATDRKDRVLIAVERMRVEVDPWAALVGHVVVDDWRLSGGRILVPPDDGYADLAPRAEGASEPEPDPTLGPELPRLVASVLVEDVEISAGASLDEAKTLARVDSLEVDAQGEGTHAVARSSFRGWVQEPRAYVERLELVVEWDEPRVTLSRLDAVASPVHVQAQGSWMDLGSGVLELSAVSARLDPRWAQEQLGRPIDDAPTILLRGSGPLDDLELTLSLGAGSLGSAELSVQGSLVPPLDASASLHVRTAPERWIPEATPGPLELGLRASLHGQPNERLRAELSARCDGCAPQPRGLSLELRANAEPTLGRIEAWADLRHGATHVEAHGAIDDGLTAQLSLDPADLAELAALAGRFGSPVPMQGQVRGDLECTASAALTQTRCEVVVAMSDGRPVQEAAVDAVVSSTESGEWSVDLSRLQLTAEPLKAALTTERARFEIGPERISVRDLKLAVATEGGRGRVELGAEYGRVDERVTAEVAVRGLDLAALDPLVPSLKARGIVRGDATLTGSLANPRGRMNLSVAGAGVRGLSLGRLTASASVGERELSSHLALRGSSLGRWTVNARVPVEISSRTQELVADGPLAVDVRGRNVALAALSPLLPAGPRVGGTARVDLGLRGSWSEPVLTAEVEGHALAYEGHKLGAVGARAGYRRAKVDAELWWEHRDVDEVVARARVPLSLDLASGNVRWHPGRDHDAEVRVRQLGLGLVEAWTAVPVAGHVSLDAALTGSMCAPELDGTLAVERVGYGGRTLATGTMQVGYRGERATARVRASGPAFRELALDAAIPLSLALHRGSAQWHADRVHDVDLSVVGVDLAEAVAWGQPKLDLGGRAALRVHAWGDAFDPHLVASVEGDTLSYGGRSVGEVSLSADYRDRSAELMARWDKDPRRFVRLHGRAPIELDPRSGRVRAMLDHEHRVTVEAPRIDPILLEPFVDLPDELDFVVALHAIGEGNATAHSLRGSCRGFGAFGAIDRQPLDVKVRIDRERQHLNARVGPAEARLELDVATRASTDRLLGGQQAPEQIPLSVSLEAPALPLALLEALAPEQLYDVRGTAKIDAGLEGSLEHPMFSGRLEIADAEATSVALRQRFEAIDTVLVLDEQELKLETLSMRSGRGTLRGEGRARLGPRGSLEASATLHSKRLPVQRPGLPYLEISTELPIELELDAQSMSLAVDVRDTEIDVISANVTEAKPIPSSANVRYTSDLDAAPVVSEQAGEPGLPSRTTAMRLRLVDPLRIRGPAIDMAWTGEIEAMDRGEGLDARGALVAQDGFFELINNRCVIERAEVTIPPAPSLRLYTDIAASAQVGEVEVTATIRGPLPHPELLLSSVPPYSASQVFTLLLTGTADFEAADSERVQAQAASLLTAFSSPALQRQINERLRVDRIGLGVGESTNQPILSVGKSLTRNVYVETQYHHNAPDQKNRAELRMRYRFAPRWSLETFVGDAAVAGLDIFWGRVFDRDAPQDAPR